MNNDIVHVGRRIFRMPVQHPVHELLERGRAPNNTNSSVLNWYKPYGVEKADFKNIYINQVGISIRHIK